MAAHNYTFVFKPDLMRPMWHDYGGYSRPGLQRHGHKWGDAERRHLYAGYMFERASITTLVQRHQRGDSGVVAQLNRIMDDCMLVHEIVRQLHQHGELIMHNLISPVHQATLQPGEQLSVSAAAPPESGWPAAADRAALMRDADLLREQVCGIPDVMKRPLARPHADVIMAYAQGQEVQYGIIGQGWNAYTPRSELTIGHPDCEWRVKPALAVRQVNVELHTDGQLCFKWPRHNPGLKNNLELTFEDAKLVGAKVIG